MPDNKWFWTAAAYVENPQIAWRLTFRDGNKGKQVPCHVILVLGGK